MPLLEELKPKNNSAASYFPVSANSANNKYDWETVVGFFIKSLHSLKLEKNIESLDDFKKLPPWVDAANRRSTHRSS